MCRCSIGLVVSACLLAQTVAQTVAHTPANSSRALDVSFAENLYIKMSSACRAIVGFSSNSADEQNELINTMKMVHLDGKMMTLYPINETFAALVKPAAFDISKQTKVIIHGFHDNYESSLPMQLAQAYNEKKMFNVLMVDAEVMLGKTYISSVRNARLVGKRLANLLANLENFGASAEDFHLLGISLGAHIAGWAGKYFQQYKGHRLGRITGMDPAGPCFSYAYSEQRLDKTDALYVDVVHSNRLLQGVIEALGHADFYLNGGGPMQPGCIMPSCSHLRAAEVYIESVRNPKAFVGVKCLNWKLFLDNMCESDMAVMGYGSSTQTRGRYYLRTASQLPYGLGMDGTKPSKVLKMNKWLEGLRTFNTTTLSYY